MTDWSSACHELVGLFDDGDANDFVPFNCIWMELPQKIHGFALKKGPHNRACLIVSRKLTGTYTLLPRSTHEGNEYSVFSLKHAMHSHQCFVNKNGWIIFEHKYVKNRLTSEIFLPTFNRCVEVDQAWLKVLKSRYETSQTMTPLNW